MRTALVFALVRVVEVLAGDVVVVLLFFALEPSKEGRSGARGSAGAGWSDGGVGAPAVVNGSTVMVLRQRIT